MIPDVVPAHYQSLMIHQSGSPKLDPPKLRNPVSSPERGDPSEDPPSKRTQSESSLENWAASRDNSFIELNEREQTRSSLEGETKTLLYSNWNFTDKIINKSFTLSYQALGSSLLPNGAMCIDQEPGQTGVNDVLLKDATNLGTHFRYQMSATETAVSTSPGESALADENQPTGSKERQSQEEEKG